MLEEGDKVYTAYIAKNEKINSNKSRIMKTDIEQVSGLSIITGALSEKERTDLFADLIGQVWQPTPFKRHVLQYGWEYNYNTTSLNGKFTDIPEYLFELAEKFDLPKPDNIIINRYLQGEGISAHTDSRVFGDTIATLTLGDSLPIYFTKGDQEVIVRPKSGDVVVMTGSARKEWKHCIPNRKTDLDDSGRRVQRGIRISITFRTVLDKYKS